MTHPTGVKYELALRARTLLFGVRQRQLSQNAGHCFLCSRPTALSTKPMTFTVRWPLNPSLTGAGKPSLDCSLRYSLLPEQLVWGKTNQHVLTGPHLAKTQTLFWINATEKMRRSQAARHERTSAFSIYTARTLKSVETETEAGGNRADYPLARGSRKDPALIPLTNSSPCSKSTVAARRTYSNIYVQRKTKREREILSSFTSSDGTLLSKFYVG